MGQYVKAYAITAEDLNLNPGTQVEKENKLLQLSCDPHTNAVSWVHTHTLNTYVSSFLKLEDD